MGLYVYYLGMSFYGWFKWGKKTQQPKIGREPKPELKPVHINTSTAWLTAGLTIMVFGGVWAVLRFLTDHPAPAMDAAITTLNMVATWLLTKAFGTMAASVVANILAIFLYHIPLWFTNGLYTVYLIASS
jgi:nicotinamide riboside transporter PnuC